MISDKGALADLTSQQIATPYWRPACRPRASLPSGGAAEGALDWFEQNLAVTIWLSAADLLLVVAVREINKEQVRGGTLTRGSLCV